MTVGELLKFLKSNWQKTKENLLEGKYHPTPAKRAELPKPDGGMRQLGIPAVLDRFIQQALLQVLQRKWDSTFLENSYGFRPQRSAHQAVQKFKEKIRSLTGSSRGVNIHRVIEDLRKYIPGWKMYFNLSTDTQLFQLLDSWIRRRLRCMLWKQWKTRGGRYKELLRLQPNRRIRIRTYGGVGGEAP